jgi:hypothetical protein
VRGLLGVELLLVIRGGSLDGGGAGTERVRGEGGFEELLPGRKISLGNGEAERVGLP